MPEKVLRLESIAGAEAMEYVWPLTAGRGSLRGAEDEHDQACEIVESIKWVGHDFSQVLDSMGDLLNSFDRHSWDNMNDIVTTFNTAVKKVRDKEKKRETTRPSRQMLRHILQQVYNTAICDPNELNHYEPFTPEVYGETSFELINQMIDQISPINNDNKFLDLGSGVGQVVLQVAALTDCQLCVGIEKAIIPSGRAVVMDDLFRKWMAWYGKKYSPYKLYQGDFLTPEHRKTISESTIVFVNNYAFGPEVDHMLKERFADLKDGARIVSSKPFCPLNFRITERNLSDIGTIMHVSVMDPLQGSVSWTDKPVSYYLHLIDSTKLERYFTKQQSHHSTRSRRTGHSLLDMDSGSNGSRSRASSLEKELGPDSPLLTSGSGDDSETEVKKGGRGSRGGRSKKRFTKKKSTPRIDGRLSKVTHFLKTLEGVEDMETTPDTSVPPSRGDSPRHSDSPDTGGSAGSGRPVREAVINAAAITEAQNDIYNNIGKRTTKMRGRGKYKHLNEGDRLPRQTKPSANTKKAGPKKNVSGLDELDQMHQETMSKINEYNESAVLPSGCTTEKLSILPPHQIFHEEMPFHLQSGEDKIPHGLHILLETMKKQYLAMIQTMQSKQYSDNIIKEIEREKAKKEGLHKRIKQLETQIDGLIKDSLKLLKARISRLGVETESPLEFIKHANTIVSSHSQLLEKKDGLQDEIKRLEQEQKELVERKEKELLEQLISQRSGGDVNLSELRSYVQREIWNCLESRGSGAPSQPMLEHSRNNSGHGHDMREGSSAPLPKLSSEVTLTKVGAPEKLKEKEKDNSFTLPRMELKLPGENSYSYAEERINQLAERQERNHHMMVDPRNGGKSGLSLSDDYEDRVKMIITAELAKEAEKKTSPIKDPKLMQEPVRRPAQNGPSPRSRLDSDPRFHSAPDYRYSGPGNMPPDSRYRGGGAIPHDLRRTPSDPRLISPHGSSGDARLISPHERRLISPHHNLPPVSSSDGGRLISPQSELAPGGRYSGPSQLDVRAAGHRLGPGAFLDQRQYPTSESNSVDVSRVPGLPDSGSRLPGVPDSGSRLPGVPDLGSRNAGAPDARNSHPLSSQDLIDMSVEKALANSNAANSSSGGSQGSRMSMVIEDSIRKEKEEKQRMVYSAVVKSDSMNEGLAVPRGVGAPGTQQPPRPSSTDRKPGGAVLPQVEGLAARFDSYLEKTKEKPGSRGSANTTGSHNTSGEGLGARFSSPDNLPPNTGSNNTASFTSRPPSTCSKSSLHTPDLADAPTRDTGDKKRVGSPLLSPVSAKSQRLDDEGGGGGGSNGGSSNSSSGGKKRDSEEAKRWQDEISMGFDRLVAMASEVDKRRKSTENSPAQGSPRKLETGKESGSSGSGPQAGGRTGSDIRMLQDSNPFDQQTLAMKIKAGLMQGGDSGNTAGGNKVKGGGGDWGGGYPPSRGEQNLPGENLPEHHFKKKYFNQEYLRQQQEERARDPVNMTGSRDMTGSRERFPPGPGYNKGVPTSKQGDTYRGESGPRGASTGGPTSTSTSGPMDMYAGQRPSQGGGSMGPGGPPGGGSMGPGGPPGGGSMGTGGPPGGGSMGPGGPPGGGSMGPGGPPGSYNDNRGRPPVSMGGMRVGPGQGDPYGDNRIGDGQGSVLDTTGQRAPPPHQQRGGPAGGGQQRGGPAGGGQVPDSRSLSSARLQDYRRFDSGGAPGSGERWGPNGPPPISSTGSSGGGPNGMGSQQGAGGGGNYDQRLDMERRRRWEEQQQQVARGMPDHREQMSREQMSRGMQDPREQMSREQMSRGMQDPRDQMSRSMQDPREQMSREQMSRSMQDPREQMSRGMQDPREQAARAMQDPRAAMFEGRGNPRMMVPPGAGAGAGMVPPGATANNSSSERQLYQGYGGPRDFDRGVGRPPGGPPGPRMPGMGARGMDPGPRMAGMGPRGPDPGSQVGPRGRDPGMQTRPPGHPDSGMQGRGPAHSQQGYYNQQMMQAMSYRHQQMMYGGGPGPGGPGPGGLGPGGPGGPGPGGPSGGPPRSQQPNN